MRWRRQDRVKVNRKLVQQDTEKSMDREASMRGESETDIWVKGCQIIHQTSYSYCIYQLKSISML